MNKYKLQVGFDEYPDNPRKWGEPLTKMVCFHNRYELGDKHNYRQDDYSSWEELKQAIIKEENVSISGIKPLYLYDHSGITISTSPFSCRWDSGQVGFVYITQENKEQNKLSDEQTQELLDAEVRGYDRYLIGEVYSYKILELNTETLELECVTNCGGYESEEMARLEGEAELKALMVSA